MSPSSFHSYHRALLDLARRLRGAASVLVDEALRKTGGEASGELSHVPLHPADHGADCYQHEVALALLESDSHLLGEVLDALRRIEGGTFGRCEECRRGIPAARLRAVPYARHCVPCAGQEERARSSAASW